MRILARTPHYAVVQADETDTGGPYVVTFDISMLHDEYIVSEYEVSPTPPGIAQPSQRNVIRLVILATEYLRNVIKGPHS